MFLLRPQLEYCTLLWAFSSLNIKYAALFNVYELVCHKKTKKNNLIVFLMLFCVGFLCLSVCLSVCVQSWRWRGWARMGTCPIWSFHKRVDRATPSTSQLTRWSSMEETVSSRTFEHAFMGPLLLIWSVIMFHAQPQSGCYSGLW